MGITRIILDTNVCLDLFVFRDPRWEAILLSLRQGDVLALTRQDCREEWLAVLHYSHLPVTDDNRSTIVAEFDQYIQLAAPTTRAILLPRCSDPDDQKFLEIARDAEVDFLITKDKALLKLARKTKAAHLFQIVTPETYLKIKSGNMLATT